MNNQQYPFGFFPERQKTESKRVINSRRARRKSIRGKTDAKGLSFNDRIREVRERFTITPKGTSTKPNMGPLPFEEAVAVIYKAKISSILLDFGIADADRNWVEYCIWNEFKDTWWDLDAEAKPYAIVFSVGWDREVDEPFPSESYIKSGHVYIDVTSASIHDVTDHWAEVESQRKDLIRDANADRKYYKPNDLDADRFPEWLAAALNGLHDESHKAPNPPSRGKRSSAPSQVQMEKDREIFEVYEAIKQRQAQSGRQRLRGQIRYDGIYDETAKTYSARAGLKEHQYLTEGEAKAAVQRHKQRMG